MNDFFKIYSCAINYHQPYSVLEHFHYPQKLPCADLQLIPLWTPAVSNYWSFCLSLFFLDISYKMEILQYIAFCTWLLSLRLMFLEFINAVTCISSLFLLIAEQYFVKWIYFILFVYSSVDGHLNCF